LKLLMIWTDLLDLYVWDAALSCIFRNPVKTICIGISNFRLKCCTL
jgi:hypothetical protein